MHLSYVKLALSCCGLVAIAAAAPGQVPAGRAIVPGEPGQGLTLTLVGVLVLVFFVITLTVITTLYMLKMRARR